MYFRSVTQDFYNAPFGFVRKQFEGKEDQAVSVTIGGRPCVFVRGVAASELFYNASRQADAVAADAAPECVQVF